MFFHPPVPLCWSTLTLRWKVSCFLGFFIGLWKLFCGTSFRKRRQIHLRGIRKCNIWWVWNIMSLAKMKWGGGRALHLPFFLSQSLNIRIEMVFHFLKESQGLLNTLPIPLLSHLGDPYFPCKSSYAHAWKIEPNTFLHFQVTKSVRRPCFRRHKAGVSNLQLVGWMHHVMATSTPV